MKPNSLLADRADATPLAFTAANDATPKNATPTRLERVWVKADGRLECHYVAANS